MLNRTRQRIRIPDDLTELFAGGSGLAWFYSPSEMRYYSFRGGVVNSRIRGVSLPDPEALFRERLNAKGIDRNSPDAQSMRPTVDTFRLWEDWKGRENA
ncbi:hypothetical protein UFOVP826_55 [uncultured Caudovirales phage]|uniref:Uncharacterized protein n=1 Tax=uncultured Caudovirales phage TaxID=2100421 RepID=A0A6J5NZY1_9CAUD|nr:hypothetical protein UFOVP826_55 [uncultured Caudovirales phage]